MLRAGAIAALRRFPRLRPLVYAAWAPVFRFALWPFRLRQGRGAPVEQEDLIRRTAEYNEAAERYYAEYSDPRFLLQKPFSDESEFARHMIAVGILVAGARLRPGDTVVEIGAGSCWLSHLLNRYGCRTVAIDVSETALSLGRQLFEADAHTNWTLEPRFLAYDGHALPLEDGSCNRVVVYDAFHHIPNQRELLAEMHRILTEDGVVAMSEPGDGHASNPTSVAETVNTGVLENELIIENVAALAESIGFSQVNVMAAAATARYEFPVRDIGRFKGGLGFHEYWRSVCREVGHHHYVLMYKASARITTERPGQLLSELGIVQPAGSVSLSRNERLRVDLRASNIGDTCWLRRGVGEERAGWTRIGVHLHHAGEPVGALIDFDWHRADLGQDVEPDATISIPLDLPAIGRPGTYDLHFDLVVENMMWFAQRAASRPPVLRVIVE